VWAEKGTRPRLKRQQQFEFAYVFGAICPQTRQAAGLVLPSIGTEAMQLHLQEISAHVPAGRHAVVVMDKASWHTTQKLACPSNISILYLPPVSPELNPVEQVWNWLRQHHWANRVFESFDHIVEVCSQTWQIFADTSDLISSIGQRAWATIL
jgi:hypothetical protein